MLPWQLVEERKVGAEIVALRGEVEITQVVESLLRAVVHL